MNEATLNLKEYRCRKCGRGFYVDEGERRDLDLDFGCPYGCDDNGRYIRGSPGRGYWSDGGEVK